MPDDDVDDVDGDIDEDDDDEEEEDDDEGWSEVVGAKKMMSTDDYDDYNEKLQLYFIS